MKKGRDPCFKCVHCGRFVPYDRRMVVLSWQWDRLTNRYAEYVDVEEYLQSEHIKCRTRSRREIQKNIGSQR